MGAKVISLWLSQFDPLDVISRDASPEVGDARQGDDEMPIAITWKPIEEVHHPVFHASCVEAENEMGDKRSVGHRAGRIAPMARQHASDLRHNPIG